MSRREWIAFVEEAEAAIESGSKLGKRNTELRVVEPFLSALGWNVRSTAVTASYRGANGFVVDYALCPEGVVGAFVVVEACEDDLRAAGRDDLLQTMRASGVDRGLYTNGHQYVLLGLPDDGDAVRDPGQSVDEGADAGDVAEAVERVEQVELSLDELPDSVEALRALSFDAVSASVAPDADAVASAIADAKGDAVERVSESLLAVAMENAVAGAVDVDATTVESAVRPLAREFVTAVVEELATDGSTRTASGSLSEPRTRAADATQTENAAGRSRDSTAGGTDRSAAGSESSSTAGPESSDVEPSVRRLGDASDAGTGSGSEFVLRFFEDGRSVGAVGNPDVDAAVAQGVTYLLEERGLGPRIQFPYAPLVDDRAFLHREPAHPDGRPMASAIDLGGLYVNTDTDLDAKREAIEALASRGGLRVMFSGDWP